MSDATGNRTGTHLDVFDDQVVQDQCIACGADTKTFGGKVERKAERFRPLCVRVGEGNDLMQSSGPFRVRPRGVFTLSLSPSTRAHPLNTNGSLAAITATTSTPFFANSS